MERVTHTSKSNSGRAFDVYAKPNWEKLCGEVAKIRVTVRVTVVDFSTRKMVEAAGVEPASEDASEQTSTRVGTLFEVWGSPAAAGLRAQRVS